MLGAEVEGPSFGMRRGVLQTDVGFAFVAAAFLVARLSHV